MVPSTAIEAIDWDQAAAQHLDGVGGLPASSYCRMWVQRTVNVFAILEGPGRVATALIRWEREGRHLVAVLVAGGGAGEGDLTANAIPLLERIAKSMGAAFVRLHTRRPGLVRKLAKRAADHEIVLSWRL